MDELTANFWAIAAFIAATIVLVGALEVPF